MTGKILGNGIIEPDSGSTIAIDDAQIPGDLRGVRNDGVGFGPVRVTSWAGSTAAIADLNFEEAEADSWIPFLSAVGLVGAAAHEEHDVEIDASERSKLTRRGLLVTIGASAFLIGTAAADEQRRFTVATFDLERNRRGLKVDVDENVADYLEGEDVEFFLSANESNVGTFDLGEPGKTINPGVEEVVKLKSDTALTFVQRLIAKARSDDSVTFDFRPRSESFANEPVGEEIELSNQAVVVETVEAADPKDTIIKMDGSVIPHADESGSSAVGEWYVRDGTSLVYVTGENTPDTTLVEIRVNAGTIERFRENYL